MKENKLTIEINKPLEEVFEFAINPKNTHNWIESIEVEKTNEWPVKLGSIYSNKDKSGEWSEYVVTDFKENEIFELSAKVGNYHVRYMFSRLNSDSTMMIYHEWVSEGELEGVFTMDIFEKLKMLIEIS